MSRLATTAIPAFVRRLADSDLAFAPRPTATILPLLVAATLGEGAHWLEPTVQADLASLPTHAAPALSSPAPPSSDDARRQPRRFLIAQVKESLVKAAVLIGVPKSIELLVQLGDFVTPDDLGQPFVRKSLEDEGRPLATLGQNGIAGLRTVYKQDLDPIFATFRSNGLEDIREESVFCANLKGALWPARRAYADLEFGIGFVSQYMTYGLALTPFAASPSESPDPLDVDPRLLSVVTLSTLVPQRTEREILWHLRGALRRGWTRDEVERIQTAIETVAAACGSEDVGRDMPRVKDIEPQAEESQAAEVVLQHRSG